MLGLKLNHVSKRGPWSYSIDVVPEKVWHKRNDRYLLTKHSNGFSSMRKCECCVKIRPILLRRSNIIGSYNGLVPNRREAIIWNNYVVILLKHTCFIRPQWVKRSVTRVFRLPRFWQWSRLYLKSPFMPLSMLLLRQPSDTSDYSYMAPSGYCKLNYCNE